MKNSSNLWNVKVKEKNILISIARRKVSMPAINEETFNMIREEFLKEFPEEDGVMNFEQFIKEFYPDFHSMLSSIRNRYRY